MLKIIWKSLWAKPARTLASIFAVAVSVMMFFSIFSFRGVVEQFVDGRERSFYGDSDISIETSSSGDRLWGLDTFELCHISGTASIVPSLTLYSLLGDEYIYCRGFEKEDLQKVNQIDV
jgi:hypothetical protein